MRYLGIDNGVSGGIAALNDFAGEAPFALLPMPTQRARKGNEVDVRAVLDWIDALECDPFTIVIEEPGGSKSAKAACSMAGSFHALRALCEARHWRWQRVTPQAWQRVILPGCKPGESKPRALAAVRALWPGVRFLATERSRVPDVGLIDAALIAEFARRTRL